MDYFFSDFTEQNYRRMLQLAKKKGVFCKYDDYFEDKVKKPIVWRHDIDVSVQRAFRLAQIEREEDVSSTFFLHFNSMFYNVFDAESMQKIEQIINMGHDVGIHLECSMYDTVSEEQIEYGLQHYYNSLKFLFGISVKAFSFHNPTTELLDCFKETQYGGLYNAYAAKIRDELAYCSDSNGYWRYHRLEDFLKEEHKDKRGICVLTHPAWWTPEILSPRKRIQRAIEGRKRYTEKKYDADLKNAGRINI